MKNIKEKFLLVSAGTVTGVLNGIFGGGGGMVVVPFLSSILSKSARVAHATAILVILPVSLASAIVYLVNGYFAAELFTAVSVGVLFGGFTGAVLLNGFSDGWATIVFSLVMFAAGLRMIF